MALVVKDRVQEITATTGTGTVTLGGAVLGYQSFATVGNGNTTYYTIVDLTTGDWEVGIGTYTASGTTLSRTTVLSSSNAGALVSFSAGTKNVFVTYPSSRSVYKDLADVYTVQQAFDALTANSIALTTGTISTAPVNNTDIVNKQYADAIASGIHFHEAVDLATTTALPANTYNNGASGVGATLTANANGALSVDSTLTVASNRILVKNEAAGANNGVYVVTQVGSAGTPYILTRATDFDTVGTGVDQIDEGDFFLVTSGVANLNTAWVQQTAPPITVGTTAIVFQQFAAPITYTAGTGLNESPSYTFNIATTGVSAATYGSASQVPVFAVNAQGQITSVTNTAIAIAAGAVSGLAASATTDTTNASNISSGTLPTGRLSGSYTGITGVGTLAAGTWNGSVIGPVYGGTGFGTYAVGDLLYADTTTSLAKLADVAVGNALISGGVGSAPSWGKIGLATHVSGTLPVLNGGTGVTSSTGTGSVVLSSSPSLVTPILGTPQSGNFSTGTFTWPTFNQNTTGNAATATTATTANSLNASNSYSGTGFTSTGGVFAAGASGFTSSTFVSNARNPIWRFGNADTYGMSYFQATAGIGGSDTIGFHFGTATAAGSPFQFISTGTLTASADMRAPIFYDSGNTSFYADPASQSVFNRLRTYGGDSSTPTQIIQAAIYPMLDWYSDSADTNNRNWRMASVYNSYGYFQILSGTTSGGTPTTARLSLSGLTGNLYVGDGVVASYRLHVVGTGYATSDFRAPIFYDSDDTTYYVDPNSRSVLSSLNVGSATTIGTGKLSVFAGGASAVGWATGFNLGDASNYTTWIQDAGVSRFRNTGTGGMDWYNSSGGTQIMSLSNAGILIAPAGSMRAPIFYDSDNTAYYGDFASTSNFNRLNLVGWDSSGRNYSREWIEFPNYTGLYSPNNGAHFYPNNQSTYTPWIVQGSRNGWHGLHFYAGGNTPHLMFDGSANGGIYYETGSRWAQYYSYGNNCTGFGTSSTSSAYNIYCPTGIYSGGRVDGTVFYDTNNTGYYWDLNGGSNISTTITGVAYFQSNINTTSSSPPLQAYSTAGLGAIMAFHRAGVYAINFGLDSDNVIRFGGWSAAANRLQMDMSGNLTMAGNVTAYSDERLKKDWANLPSDFIECLAKVKSGTYTRIDSDERQVGVSAQGLQKFIGEAVQTDNSGMLSVNYGGAALASAVELAKYTVALEQRIAQLEKKLEALVAK